MNYLKTGITIIYLLISYGLNIEYSLAISINEAISIAIEKNTKISLSQKESELTSLKKRDAISEFLPSLNAQYIMGKRKTEILDNIIYSDEDSKSIILIQPIFNGFSSVIGYKKAKIEENISLENTKIIQNEIAFNVASSFLYVFYLRKNIILRKENISLLEESSQLAKNKLNVGNISYKRYYNILSKVKNEFLNLSKDQLKLNEEITKLKDFLKIKEITNLEESIIDSDITYETALDKLNKHNPQLKSLNYKIKANAYDIKSNYSNLSPEISIALAYEKQNNSYYFSNNDISNRSAYLNVTIPIFQSGNEYNNILKSNKEEEILTLNKNLILEDLVKNLKQEFNKIQSLYDSENILSNIIVSSKKGLQLAQEQFKTNYISKIDLFLQKSVLMDLLIEENSIKIKKNISIFKIKELIGYYSINSL